MMSDDDRLFEIAEMARLQSHAKHECNIFPLKWAQRASSSTSQSKGQPIESFLNRYLDDYSMKWLSYISRSRRSFKESDVVSWPEHIQF